MHHFASEALADGVGGRRLQTSFLILFTATSGSPPLPSVPSPLALDASSRFMQPFGPLMFAPTERIAGSLRCHVGFLLFFFFHFSPSVCTAVGKKWSTPQLF